MSVETLKFSDAFQAYDEGSIPFTRSKPLTPCKRWSSAAVNLSQVVLLAVAQPRDVGDPPVILDLDEVEPHRRRLIEVGEFDGGGGVAGRAVVDRDIDIGNFPILSVDERIEVEQTDFATFGGDLLVLDHQCCERRLEIEPDGAFVVGRVALASLPL